MERWRGWRNAEIYDRFVRENRIYAWLNARLVERVGLGDARRVLDLGCGTGATTWSCLPHIPANAAVVGLDASAEMIEVARANLLDPRVTFVVANAAEVADAVTGTFDRALSNAAFWQSPRQRRVLEGLAQRLSRGATFVFNVPAERVAGLAAPIHPFQAALARAIAEESGEPFVRVSTPFDREQLREDASHAGFTLERLERLDYEGQQRELMDLMEVPALIAPLVEGLSEDAIDRVLTNARSRVEPKERVRVPWLYFTLRRR